MRPDATGLNKPAVLRLLRPAIGIAVMCGVFFFIFRNVKIDDVTEAVKHVSTWTIPFLFSAVLASMFLQGVRWWILVRAFTDDFTLSQALSVHFKSIFYSLFLPNSTVAEVVRSVAAVKHIGPVASWSATWINKIAGIITAYFLSMYGLMQLAGKGIPAQTAYVVYGMFAIMLLLVLVSFSKKLSRPIGKLAERIIPRKLVLPLQNIRQGIYQFKNHKKRLAASIVITLLVQVLLVIITAVTIMGVTGHLLVKECFAFIPLIEMVSMAQPLTPNGIGVRDALIALMFTHLGLTKEQLAVYLIIANLSILVKLVGVVPVAAEAFVNCQKQK